VPGVPSHSKSPSRPSFLANLSSRQRAIAGGSILAIIAVVVIVLVVAGGSKPSTTAASGGTTPTLAGNLCPLTGLPAAGGAVPPRPALLVKIGNEPGTARPQSGLNEADIVYDTPAEGFIMRYMAVYQCSDASSIGPIRSVRWVDYHVAREFIDPILAFAGGINPNVNTVMATSWLHGANLLGNASAAGHRITSRSAPDNLYTATTPLYAMFKSRTDIPKPVFAYSRTVPTGSSPASSAKIDFSGGTDVTWTWSSSANTWLHGYVSTGADTDQASGSQVSAENVIIEEVHYKVGPYLESTGGSGDIESQTLGTGNAIVLRNGQQVKVTWHRKDPIAPTTFTDASGKGVALMPGRTWVELVPDSVYTRSGAVTITS
jgi:Protein of unknown function (DUF3048) N-terminal domain/Protein of unknown function (DUF3048) C-terminal domain